MLMRRARRLADLAPILDAARLEGQAAVGLRELPLDRVVGTAAPGRTEDFDRSFLPTDRRIRDRWTRLYAAVIAGAEIPPIDVYELEGDYYVIDGHHRVSVYRSLGRTTIPARVIEVRTRAPLESGTDRAALLRAAEYAAFLEITELDRLRPNARLEVGRLGRYDVILAHVLGHRHFLALETGREPEVPEAAASWYDTVFVPIARLIARHRVLETLPGWTETDVYVEVTRRWLHLGKAGELGAHPAVHSLLDERAARGWWRRRGALRL